MAKKRYYSSGAKMGSSMMPSGMGEFACMPQKSFMKAIPSSPRYSSSYATGIKSIDRQIAKDVSGAKRQKSDIKY